MFFLFKKNNNKKTELFYDLETSPKWEFPMKH